MALKIDRLDSKKCTPETATKSYIEVSSLLHHYLSNRQFLPLPPPSPSHPPSLSPPQVRAEVSLLHKLHHDHVIDFIGVVLQPLCFILEWACGGSLNSFLSKYRKVDARISPHILQQAAIQVRPTHMYCMERSFSHFNP